MQTDTETRTPTISRVCTDTLVELVFDAGKRETRLAVSRFGGLWNLEQEVKIETGEILYPYPATNNLIANNCVLLPSEPKEHGFKHELVADIRAYLHRYVDLSPEFELIASYYVLLSWVHDAFSDLPYLRLLGDFGTGKTRGLVAIGSICYRPFFASGASTVSPIFHTLDRFGGTLVLDEADLPYSDARADLVKILNNGTMKGMPVLRTMINRRKEFDPYAFRVFGPKLIAAREPFQDEALESRFLTERTGVRTLRPDIPAHTPPELHREALDLRNRLLHFRFCEYFAIKTDTAALLQTADARLNQMTLALMSVVDDAEAREAMRRAFLAQQEETVHIRRERPEASVLEAALSVFATATGSDVPVREIAAAYNASFTDMGPVSNRWIGSMLRTKLGLRTRKTRGTYVVALSEREKLGAAARRYGIPN